MNNLITTLVIEALDSAMSTQADATATSIANAASTNRLAVQRDGAFVTGDLTDTTADQLLKLSAATTMSDGTVSVMSSSEFKLGDIVASHYAVPTASSAGLSTIAYANAEKVGGQFFVRLERKNGINVSDTETYSGETLTQLKNEFDAAKASSRTEFDNVSLSITSTTLTVSVAPKDSDSEVYLSANEGATVSLTGVNDKRGSLTVAKGLEKSGFITMGAYNQYKFPIVIPETSTASGQDYGIYTIELRKKVGKRYVFETIKVLIADDEANANKTAQALNNLLSLTAADSTAPTLTTAQFSTDDGTVATNSDYSAAASSAMYIVLAGASAAGDTVTVTVTSAEETDAGHDQSKTFTLATATDVLELDVTADQFTVSTELTATTVITDSSGNTSATKTDTVTTAGS